MKNYEKGWTGGGRWSTSFSASGFVHLSVLAAAVWLPLSLAHSRGATKAPKELILSLAPVLEPVPFSARIEPLLPVELPTSAGDLPEITPIEIVPIDFPPPAPDVPLDPVDAHADDPGFRRIGPRPRPAEPEPKVVESVELPPEPTPPEPAAPSPITVPPAFLRDASPTIAFPSVASRRGWTGTAICLLTIAPDGSVTDAVLVESSGHRVLDEAALAGVRHWRFKPGTRAGAAVEMDVLQRVDFRKP